MCRFISSTYQSLHQMHQWNLWLMSSQYCDTGFIDPHVTDGEKELWSEFQLPAVIQHSDFISQLHSWGTWFSLAFSLPPLVQFGVYPFWFCGVYMWGVGHGVSSHKF